MRTSACCAHGCIAGGGGFAAGCATAPYSGDQALRGREGEGTREARAARRGREAGARAREAWRRREADAGKRSPAWRGHARAPQELLCSSRACASGCAVTVRQGVLTASPRLTTAGAGRSMRCRACACAISRSRSCRRSSPAIAVCRLLPR